MLTIENIIERLETENTEALSAEAESFMYEVPAAASSLNIPDEDAAFTKRDTAQALKGLQSYLPGNEKGSLADALKVTMKGLAMHPERRGFFRTPGKKTQLTRYAVVGVKSLSELDALMAASTDPLARAWTVYAETQSASDLQYDWRYLLTANPRFETIIDGHFMLSLEAVADIATYRAKELDRLGVPVPVA